MKTLSYYCRAFKQISKYEPLLIPLTVLLALSSGIKPFVNIYLSAEIIAELTYNKDIPGLVTLVIASVVINMILQILSESLQPAYSNLRSRLYIKERIEIERKLFTIDYASLESSEFQELIHLHRESSEKVYSAFTQLCFMMLEFIKGLIGVVGAVILLIPLIRIGFRITGEGFFHTPWFLVVLLVAILISIAIILLLSLKNSKMLFKAQEKYTKMDKLFHFYRDFLVDYKSGKEVRIYKEKKLIQKEASEKLLDDGEKILREVSSKTAKSNSYIAIIGTIIGFGVYLYIGIKGLYGLIGVEDLVLYIGAFMQAIQGLTSISITLGQGNELVPNLKYFFDIVQTKREKQYGQRTIDSSHIEIEFRHVSFKYPAGDAYVIKDVSLKISDQERLAIVGRNGSGKTTFIKLLCRLYDPTSGEILVNGVNIKELTKECCFGLYSIVFQDFKLFDLSLADNVTLSINKDKKALDMALEKSGIKDWVSTLPLQENTYLYKDLDQGGIDISGGEAQKVALARAIYKNAPITILDEPTAALDPIAEYHIYKQLDHVFLKRTSIFISHRLSSCKFCDTIVVFNKGQIVQTGLHNQLLTDKEGEYYRLWNAQAQYYIKE